ncbi:MAG: hypothetical protein JWR68_1078 [Polaromonas sp.]|nr:hypothetical protein [Polaromonas sp.]
MLPSVSRIFRFILKLVLGLSAAVIAVGLILMTVILFSLSLLKSMITGRPSPAAVAFGRFRQSPAPGLWPNRRPAQGAPKAASGQVVDVEVREIPEPTRHF